MEAGILVASFVLVQEIYTQAAPFSTDFTCNDDNNYSIGNLACIHDWNGHIQNDRCA